MNNNVFYDDKSIPLAVRESFNNTVLLLTMVKSRYYYIVGFSRPQMNIKIGFDFESELHRTVWQEANINFASDGNFVSVTSFLSGVVIASAEDILPKKAAKGMFHLEDDKILYTLKIPKDNVFPVSIREMNNYILTCKREITDFIEANYRIILNN